jgi:hypothetical protein
MMRRRAAGGRGPPRAGSLPAVGAAVLPAYAAAGDCPYTAPLSSPEST